VAQQPHEADRLLLAPMGLLAALCIVIGLFPSLVLRLLRHPLYSWAPGLEQSGVELAALAPVGWLTATSVAFLATAFVLALFFRSRMRRSATHASSTWGCGYAAPTARMQYTASSFADILVLLLRSVLHPRGKKPALRDYFPTQRDYASTVPDLVLDLVILPTSRLVDRGFSFVRKLQHGEYHLYVLYIFITLTALLIWAR
jgi:hydrogenase-4 component B